MTIPELINEGNVQGCSYPIGVLARNRATFCEQPALCQIPAPMKAQSAFDSVVEDFTKGEIEAMP